MQCVAMPPDAERALDLYICEVMVPFELGNLRNPRRPDAQEGKDAKRSNDLRTQPRDRLRY